MADTRRVTLAMFTVVKPKGLPEFDVTSGGSLSIESETLIKSPAAQRQIDAVERLASKHTPKKKIGTSGQ